MNYPDNAELKQIEFIARDIPNAISLTLSKIKQLNPEPKWRVPNVDGFPEHGIECLFLLHTGIIIDNTIMYFDFLMDRKNIVKWMYRKDFDKIMEVNK